MKNQIYDNNWGTFNQRLIEHAYKKQWGFYRNNKLDMAMLLKKELKLKQALSTLLEVCYLDLNGCNNVPIYKGKPSLKALSQ